MEEATSDVQTLSTAAPALHDGTRASSTPQPDDPTESLNGRIAKPRRVIIRARVVHDAQDSN